MRKLLALLLAFALMGSLLSCAAAEMPETFTSGVWEYRLLEDGTVELTKYIGYDVELVIPSLIEGKQVTSIGYYALGFLDFLKSVTIPDGVVSIGRSAFYGCDSLSSVFIPDSVKNVDGNPFQSCNKLTDIRVSPDNPYLATIDGVLFSKLDKRLICYPYAFNAEEYEIPQGILEIGDDAFYDCYSLKSVTIPDSVVVIGNWAFSSCQNLAAITIPHGVTTIGKSAFNFCKSLTSVTISDGVENIGVSAFLGCGSLTEISIPDSVVNLEGNPFASCNQLAEIRVSPEHPYLEVVDGVLFSKPDKRLVYYPCALDSTEYEIPQGTLVIAEEAFFGCNALASISIPDSVRSIGSSAFTGRISFKTVTIPEGVESIEWEAFCNCLSMTSVVLPKSVISMEKDVFRDCDQVVVTVPRDSYAKQYCEENGIKYTYADANDWLNE